MTQNPFTMLWDYYDTRLQDDRFAHKQELFYKSPYEPLIQEQGYFVESRLNINISSITTKLIQETGRFCEMHASDLLISLDSLDKIIQNPNSCMEPYYEFFGIRKQGVDGISYLISRITDKIDTPWELNDYYRKLYGIRVIHTNERNLPYSCYIYVELRDFTNDICMIANYFKKSEFDINDYYHLDTIQNQKELLTALFDLQKLQEKFQKQKSYIYEKIQELKLSNETLTDIYSITNKDIVPLQNAIQTVYQMLNPKEDPFDD